MSGDDEDAPDSGHRRTVEKVDSAERRGPIAKGYTKEPTNDARIGLAFGWRKGAVGSRSLDAL